MSKTVKQLTATTTLNTFDLIHVVDINNDQDKKMTAGAFWSSKPYGELYLYENASATTIAVATTPVLITNGGAVTTTVGLTNKFTHDSATGKLTYTGEEDVTVKIDYTVTMQSASGSIGAKVFTALNGTNETKSKSEVQLTATTWVTVTKTIILTLSENDYIQNKVSNETSTANIIVQDYNLNITTL